MMTSILIHRLNKGTLASKLERDPPPDVEELLTIAEKYILEEEMNILEENEWKLQAANEDDQKKGKKWKDKAKADSEKDPVLRYKRFHEYTSLTITRVETLMNIEKKLLQWPPKTRPNPAN